MQWFRGGLVFKAHRRLYHSTLGLRVIKKKKKKYEVEGSGYEVQGSGYEVQGSGYDVEGSEYEGSGYEVEGSGQEV